jgi:hypothetical protein
MARRDLSVGFYYEDDRTSGTWNGQPYDYVQRNFVFDHVASVDHGRCSFPACGIGVDASQLHVRIGQSKSWEETDRELTSEQRNRIPKRLWGYTPSENRSEWKLLMPDREHIIAALQALQGARGGVDIPRSALAEVKRKVCARARSFGIKTEYCGTADGAATLLRTLRAMTRPSLVALHARLHKADDFVSEGVLHRAVLFALKKSS